MPTRYLPELVLSATDLLFNQPSLPLSLLFDKAEAGKVCVWIVGETSSGKDASYMPRMSDRARPPSFRMSGDTVSCLIQGRSGGERNMPKRGLIAIYTGMALFAAASNISAHAQVIAEPCETCGLELGKALPEGVTFLDVEGYGGRDDQPNRLGVNIPTLAWSTPYSFYNTRLEVFAILPVTTHIDGQTMNRFDYYASSLIVGGAHDFGNGFHVGVFAGPRSGDNFLNLGRQTAADIRGSLVYEKDGFQAIATFVYSGNFGGRNVPLGSLGTIHYNDNAFIDYTLLKMFGKFQIGVVGSAVEDITGPVPIKPGSISVGGLVGYDFGSFKLQGYVTREVAIRAGGWGLGPTYVYGGANGGRETRGYVRVEIPLYKAPMAPSPVSARY